MTLVEKLKKYVGHGIYSKTFGNCTIHSVTDTTIFISTNKGIISLDVDGKMDDEGICCIQPTKDIEDFGYWFDINNDDLLDAYAKLSFNGETFIKNVALTTSNLALLKIQLIIDKLYGGLPTINYWLTNGYTYVIAIDCLDKKLHLKIVKHSVYNPISFMNVTAARRFIQNRNNQKLIFEYLKLNLEKYESVDC